MKQIEWYDTTCRDGGQDPEIDFTTDAKSKIIDLLDDFGVDFIEVGYSLNNTKEDALYTLKKTKTSKLVAFGSTANSKNILDVSKDKGLQSLINTKAKYITIFGKTWIEHVKNQLNITPDENLKLIFETVKFLHSKGCEVIYDAEHFYSQFFEDEKEHKQNFNKYYALKTLTAAIDAGANRIVLCDTKGGCLPRDIRHVNEIIKQFFNDNKYEKIIFGFHGHNDSDCASANSLEFIETILSFRSTVHIQGTFNKYGERSGNAPINIVIADTHFKLKFELRHIDLKKLKPISEEIAFIAQKDLDPQTPYVGRYVFAHKAGVHIQGVRKGARYDHIDPTLVGNKTRYLLTSQSGREAMVWFLEQYGYKLSKDDEQIPKLLEIVHNLSREGFDLNVSDAVGELFLWDNYLQRKRLINFSNSIITISSQKNGSLNENFDEAKIEKGLIIDKKGKIFEIKPTHKITKGGPVDATFNTIKKAVSTVYPEVEKIKMIYYKTKIPHMNGESSNVFTVIGFSDEKHTWMTAGFDPNSLFASFDAIVNGFEYYITKFIKD